VQFVESGFEQDCFVDEQVLGTIGQAEGEAVDIVILGGGVGFDFRGAQDAKAGFGQARIWGDGGFGG